MPSANSASNACYDAAKITRPALVIDRKEFSTSNCHERDATERDATERDDDTVLSLSGVQPANCHALRTSQEGGRP